jgi:uncharacterized protein YkwD
MARTVLERHLMQSSWLLILSVLLVACVGVEQSGRHPETSGPPAADAGPDVRAARDARTTEPDAVPLGGFDGGRAEADAAPVPDPPPDDDLTAEEQDLLRAINDERAGSGLPPVTIDERLQCAARRHALDVGGSGACGHVGADGSWPWDRAMACGFPQETWTVNEIAAGPGFTDGADAVWGWSQSSGHYAALMHTRAASVGVAVHRTCFIALFDCCVAGSE